MGKQNNSKFQTLVLIIIISVNISYFQVNAAFLGTDCSGETWEGCVCDGATCESCTEGFRLQTELNPAHNHCCALSCQTCSDHTDADICDSCSQYAHYFDVGESICKPCADNCIACDSLTVCTNCVSEYYYLDTADTTCKSCPDNCIGCNYNIAGPVCQTCITGYYKGHENQCVQCMDNCNACSVSGTVVLCTQCAFPYVLDPYKNCQTCGNNCVENSCVYNEIKNLMMCTACLGGNTQYPDENGICQSCPDTCYLNQCQFINDGPKCTNCPVVENYYDNSVAKLSYVNVNNECIACGTGCVTCVSDQSILCVKCLDYNTLVISLTVQLTDHQFYFLDSATSECVACPSNCAQCYAQNQCTVCKQDYFFHQENSCLDATTQLPIRCAIDTNAFQAIDYYNGVKIQYRYVNQNGECSYCSDQNCRICALSGTSDTCTRCYYGYGLNSSGDCKKCPDNCDTCNYDTKAKKWDCLNCQANYYRYNKFECKELGPVYITGIIDANNLQFNLAILILLMSFILLS